MFTYGREHELKQAVDFIGNAEKAALLTETINAVHDFVEEKTPQHKVSDVLYKAIAEGKGGIWESAGSWLRKIGHEYPEFLELWEKLATHKSARVRFRVAAHINDLPDSVFPKICQTLLNDNSAAVRSKIAGDLYFSKHSEAVPLLRSQREREDNEDVLESIEFAIQGIVERA